MMASASRTMREISSPQLGATTLNVALSGEGMELGNMGVDWDLEKLFDAARRGTGTDALRELHAKMGEHRAAFDLDALWKELGVRVEHGRVTFDDTAELAATRKAITATRP